MEVDDERRVCRVIPPEFQCFRNELMVFRCRIPDNRRCSPPGDSKWRVRSDLRMRSLWREKGKCDGRRRAAAVRVVLQLGSPIFTQKLGFTEP